MKVNDARYVSVLSAFVNNGKVTDEQLKAINSYDESDKAFKGSTREITKDTASGIIRVSDLMETTNATRFLPKVIKTVIKEAVEPNLLVVPNVFTEIRLNTGTSIEMGAIGALTAGDVQEGREYPESKFDLDGGDMISISVKKSGIMIRITDEMVKDSQWDVINIWIKMAGKAMARHKEVKAMALLNKLGQTIFDNDNPAASLKGMCTGRGIDGAPNGALSQTNMFELVAALLLNGFNPNTIIMHPFAWAVFAMDPVMKEIALGPNLKLPMGNAGNVYPTGHNGLGLDPQAQTPFTATYHTNPEGSLGGLNVLVSPYVPFDATKQTCTIILLDKESTGLLVTREDLNTEKFDEPQRDISGLKIMERYGFGVINQGKGVAVAKNVAIQPNYTFTNANNHSLGGINPMVPLASQGGGVNPAGAYLGN